MPPSRLFPSKSKFPKLKILFIRKMKKLFSPKFCTFLKIKTKKIFFSEWKESRWRERKKWCIFIWDKLPFWDALHFETKDSVTAANSSNHNEPKSRGCPWRIARGRTLFGRIFVMTSSAMPLFAPRTHHALFYQFKHCYIINLKKRLLFWKLTASALLQLCL